MKKFKDFTKTLEAKIEKKDSEEPFFYPLKTVFGAASVKFHVLKTVFGTHAKQKKDISEESSFPTDHREVEQDEETLSKVHHNKVEDPDHIKAIHHYTDDSFFTAVHLHKNYEKIHQNSSELDNKHVRKAGDNHLYHAYKIGTLKQIKSLDKMFSEKKHYVGMDHTVYTGLRESPRKTFGSENKDHEKLSNHIHAHLPAFTSTSTSYNKARGFSQVAPHDSERHVLKIRVPADHPSISIQHHSNIPSEKEVLLHRGTRIKIHGKPYTYLNEKTKQINNIWHAEVVGHHLDEVKE